MRRYNTAKLIAARLEKGWSQSKVAAIASVLPATVYRVENGLYHKPETVAKIAAVLGVDMSELMIKGSR